MRDITHGVGLGRRVCKEVRVAMPSDTITEVAGQYTCKDWQPIKNSLLIPD